MTPRRKSIARRRPIIVYRLEPIEGGTIRIRGWMTDDDLMGRLDERKYLGAANITGYAGPARGQWFDSRDTDSIHGLPKELRDAVFQVDDAWRAIYARGEFDWQ